MKRRDPVSTPARRRRIIAEFAKKTLRLYCIDACNGVITFRAHTKASLSIQCWIRFHMARRKVAKLIYERRRRAAIKIQCMIRRKLAILRRKKLFSERLLRRQLRLNACVHQLIYIRKQKLARVAMLIALRLAREKKEKRSAIDIQRVFRGFQARKIYRKMFAEYQAYLRLRYDAAVRIQSEMRRFLAVKRFKYYSSRRKAMFLINEQVNKWWKFRTFKRRRSAVIIQSMIRGYLGKAVVRGLRQRKEAKIQQVTQLLCAQIHVELIDEMITQLVKELVPVEKSMTIHVDVDCSLLEHMERTGAAAVVKWSLANSILEFCISKGFRAGAVVQQVVRSVESALLQPVESSSYAVKESHDRVIALDKWDEGDATDLPGNECLPSDWGVLAYETKKDELQQMSVGAAVSVECISNVRIELHITTVSESTFQHSFTRSIVIIAFNKSEDTAISSPENIIENSNCSKNEEISFPDKVVGIQDLKFRFKNALVFVNNVQPSAPLEPIETEEEEEEEICDNEDEEDQEDDDDDDEIVSIVPDQKSPVRPSTAVVRIVLREPTPPPAPIDYDSFAITLQMLVRRRYRIRVRLVKRIQRAVRRCRRVFIWQELVYSMLEVGHDAATIIQCWLRRAAAQRLLDILKELRYRSNYGHNFLLDEKENWAAFGLPLPPTSVSENQYVYNTDAAELVFRSPIVGVTLTATALGGLVGEVGDVAEFVQAFSPPPVADVLRLLDYTVPPPGCAYLTNGSGAEFIDSGSGPQLMLAIEIADEHYNNSANRGQKSASDRVDQYFSVKDPVLRALEHLPNFCYEGSIRSRAVQEISESRFVGNPNSCPQGSQIDLQPPLLNTDDTSMAGNPPKKKALSQSDTFQYRKNHLGDVAAQDIAVFAGDLTEWLSVRGSAGVSGLMGKDLRSAQLLSLENTAPVYQALAANLY